MGLKDYCFDGDKKPELDKLPTDSKCSKADKAEILKRTEKNLLKMAELQEKLYADGREGVIFVLQAMDAAGKDSTVKHV
ncbi:MAG: polyphosphate kinase 2 family protein, partial [Ruthenibacterium sp.]